jgi:sortase A
MLALGITALGYCALVYLQARIFQTIEGERFEKELRVPESRVEETDAPIRSIEIPRLEISAMVVEGVSASSLRVGVGHVPGTALPGGTGNVGIAGHRDTFFRNLRHIREGDTIRLRTLDQTFEYSVNWTRVVNPADVDVLASENEPDLTLVTCYPFFYLGPAPQRFIVRARRIRSAQPTVSRFSIPGANQ